MPTDNPINNTTDNNSSNPVPNVDNSPSPINPASVPVLPPTSPQDQQMGVPTPVENSLPEVSAPVISETPDLSNQIAPVVEPNITANTPVAAEDVPIAMLDWVARAEAANLDQQNSSAQAVNDININREPTIQPVETPASLSPVAPIEVFDTTPSAPIETPATTPDLQATQFTPIDVPTIVPEVNPMQTEVPIMNAVPTPEPLMPLVPALPVNNLPVQPTAPALDFPLAGVRETTYEGNNSVTVAPDIMSTPAINPMSQVAPLPPLPGKTSNEAKSKVKTQGGNGFLYGVIFVLTLLVIGLSSLVIYLLVNGSAKVNFTNSATSSISSRASTTTSTSSSQASLSTTSSSSQGIAVGEPNPNGNEQEPTDDVIDPNDLIDSTESGL